MPEFTGQRDLQAYLKMFWRWKLLVIALVVAAPAIAYFVEHRKPKIYQAQVTLAINPSAAPSGNSVFASGNLSAIAAVVTTSQVANLAGAKLRPKVPGSVIVGEVSASANATTDFLTITATDQSPTRAAQIANAFAYALGADEYQQLVSSTDSQISAIKAQLRNLSRTSAEYAQLQQQIGQDKAQLQTESRGPQIIQAATPNYTPVGPHIRRAVELALVIGILLAAGAVLLLEGADRGLHSPDDLERLTSLPLLAAIGQGAFKGVSETDPADEEAFQMLRTSLTYFAAEERLNSILVTSPFEQEGKSTVATGLALAAARANVDVILVDCDLRRAGTSQRFSLADTPGLSSVIAESRPAESVLTDWKLPKDATGRLRVLPAGSVPANPAALVDSPAMRALLRHLESICDLVIIDTPAALAVSDAVPLMSAVSGVVLVARMNQSNRAAVNRLQKIVVAAHGRLLGAVATAVRSGAGYSGYARHYYATTHRQVKRHGRKVRADSASGLQLTQAPPMVGAKRGSESPTSDHDLSA
jgi:capsular exopolysaccharide synthesis family protein